MQQGLKIPLRYAKVRVIPEPNPNLDPNRTPTRTISLTQNVIVTL